MAYVGNRSQKEHCYFTIILCAIYMTPILFRFMNAYIQLGLFFGWCVYSLYLLDFKVRKDSLKVLVPIVLMIVLEILYFVIGKSSAAVGNYFKVMKFYQTICMFLFVNKHYAEVYKQKLTNAIIYIFGANIIYNILMYLMMPEYINYTGRSERITASATNIFNTMYATATMIFCGVLLCALLYPKIEKRKKRVLMVLFVASLFYTLVVAERATNFILIVLMLGLVLCVRFLKVNHPVRLVLFTIIICVVVIILYCTILPELLLRISELLNSERVAKRIMSIYYVLKGADINNVTGTLDTRYKLTITSINTFLESVPNFLFGIGNHIYNSVNEAYELGIGGHSQLIDIFAKYGILGGGLVITILHNTYRAIKAELNSTWCVYFIIVFWVFLARSLLGNTFEPEMGIIVFLLMPLLQSRNRTE